MQKAIKQSSALMMIIIFTVTTLVLSGCASSPFKMEGVNQSITPQQTLDNKALVNSKVVWGGMIIETRNFKNNSQIELLIYPLHSNGEPIKSAQPQGRFLIKHDGFLEPAQYSSGRFLSALGKVQTSEAGKIGEANYQYPVIKAEQLHLWEEYQESDSRTRFSIGIGIGL